MTQVSPCSLLWLLITLNVEACITLTQTIQNLFRLSDKEKTTAQHNYFAKFYLEASEYLL